MDFEKSFNALKNPLVWLHYALGTLGLVAIFWYLMTNGILAASSPFTTYLIVFYVVYIVVDRLSHGILELR